VTARRLRIAAPAKLNLYLRVLGKRPDGYHELETLFERIDLADELTAEPASGLTLTCDDPTLSCGPDNLVLKAARLLQQTLRMAAGARLHLTKRIPVAAGLGGGSSDAAAALVLLCRLWQADVPRQRLVDLADQLGSDVPFFLQPEAFAIGTGRGEQCEPLATPLRLAHVLVAPDTRLSTPEIYAGSQFDLTAQKPSISMVRHALCNGSLGELAKGFWNDLEPEAIRRCPVISITQARLRQLGCLGTRLSGSGPSVFGLCRDAAHAQEVLAQLRRDPEARDWRMTAVHTESANVSATGAVRWAGPISQ
jgi:4-diphosphocytidyl-2-C-methyl-D-erythritol kinase